jgi:hypothetical protein
MFESIGAGVAADFAAQLEFFSSFLSLKLPFSERAMLETSYLQK